MSHVIIDFHTHIYPNHLAPRTLAAIKDRAEVRSYTDGTLHGLMRSMKESGVDVSVVSGIATKPEQVESIHEWLKAIGRPSIYPLATMHPGCPPDHNRIKHLKSLGFRGYKLHPDYQGFFVDERRMYPFYEAAHSEGLFLLFHAGVDRGLPSPIHATPERLARVHRDLPGLCMIVAHMGGEDMYLETQKHLLGRDVYLDTSFVLRKMRMDLIQRFFDKHSTERFLFGTDSPWTDQKRELQFFLSLPFLPDEDKEKVTSVNPARLLGLGC